MQGQGKQILAVASEGGHWIQLRRLQPVFDGHRMTYASTQSSYRNDVGDAGFYRVPNASRWNKVGLILLALRMLWILIRVRPEVVISTGAAPGYFALRFGKMLGARTVWVDSLANAEEMSLSGRRVRRFADLWLTQWEHLANPGGPQFVGTVL